ncbi:MAG TPA: hypothetical protein VF324_00540, partial [Methanobacterium sp.]
MESFFGFILSDSMIFNSFFNYTFICKKWVSELRRFGTTERVEKMIFDNVVHKWGVSRSKKDKT